MNQAEAEKKAKKNRGHRNKTIRDFQLCCCCDKSFKGDKKDIVNKAFIKKVKVDVWYDGQWCPSPIKFLPNPPIKHRTFGTSEKSEHQLGTSLNQCLNSILHQTNNGIIILKKKLFGLKSDFKFSFKVKDYLGKPCPFSGGELNRSKIMSIENIKDEFVHIQSAGRYEETQQEMAPEEFAKVYNVKSADFLDLAKQKSDENGKKLAHISESVKEKHYCPTKSPDMRDLMMMRPDDMDKKLVELAANNPDEFPWSDDVCIQRCKQPTDSLVNHRWRSHVLSTEEQSARQFSGQYSMF